MIKPIQPNKTTPTPSLILVISRWSAPPVTVDVNGVGAEVEVELELTETLLV